MDKVDQAGISCRISSRTPSRTGIVICTVAGWLAAAVSLVRYPFIFGVAAIILGIRISKNGNRAGMPLIAGSILLMALGLIFNTIIYDYLKKTIGV